MYGYRNWVVIVVSMICFATPYGDVPFRSSQGATEANYDSFSHDNTAFLSPGRREISQENYRHQYTQFDKGQNVDSVRHTHTSTRVVHPDANHFHNGPTTVRNYIKQETNTRNQFNMSNTPHLNRSGNKRKSQAVEDETRMVYPTELEEQVSRNASVMLRSRSCFDGLCDEVEGYPTDMVNRILSRSKDLKKFFSTKISEVIVTTTPKIDSRFGEGGAAVEPLCVTHTQTRYPQSAVNMKNVEQLLVNVDNYKQGIAYETCASADEPCKFAQTFPQDYISSCTQRYTVRKLMVVSKESDNPVFDDFKIPSCCVCTVKMMSGKT